MKQILIGAFFFSIFSSSQALAQADPLTAWAAGETVNNIIANISDQARDRIAQIEGVGSNVMMEGRTHIIVALQNAELIADKLREKTFADLNDQQKRFFGNLKIALDNFDKTRNDSFKQIKDTIADVDSALGTIPGSDKSPRINRYSPSYVVLDNKNNFEIAIDGGWVGYGEPSLTVGKDTCPRKTKTDRSLTFICEKSALAKCDAIKGRSLELKLYDRPGWFAWFSNPKEFKFDIGISCVPEKAADINGTLSLSSMKQERRTRSQDWWVGKGHCEGPTSVNWIMNADAINRWQIDVASVKAIETTKIGNTSWQLVDLTAASFAIRGSVANHGSCGPRVFGQHVGLDGRGSLGVRVIFDEIRPIPAESQQKLDGFQMAWGNDYTIPMPTDARGFVLNVRQIDGRQRVASTNGDYGWFSVEHNIDAKILSVKVKTAQDAFSSKQ